MDIYLIRHTRGKVDSNVCYGQTDIPLTDDFTETFKLIKNQFPNLLTDFLVITSPLQRCVQLAKKLSASITIDKRIMELNFGTWEMQKWDAINQMVLQEWMDDYVNIAPPSGESFQDLSKRCQDFWSDIITSQTRQTIIVVTHLGVIRALLALVLEIPLQKSLCIQVDYGAINKLIYHTDITTKQAWTTVEYLNKNRPSI